MDFDQENDTTRLQEAGAPVSMEQARKTFAASTRSTFKTIKNSHTNIQSVQGQPAVGDDFEDDVIDDDMGDVMMGILQNRDLENEADKEDANQVFNTMINARNTESQIADGGLDDEEDQDFPFCLNDDNTSNEMNDTRQTIIDTGRSSASTQGREESEVLDSTLIIKDERETFKVNEHIDESNADAQLMIDRYDHDEEGFMRQTVKTVGETINKQNVRRTLA